MQHCEVKLVSCTNWSAATVVAHFVQLRICFRFISHYITNPILMKLKDASSVTVTYPAEAVFSLVDGPYSSDCKYAKMNQTLTATYSS